MNIYDIANLAGVSIATVSRVVNNSEKVSEKTREKILGIMKQEGYTPNAFARGLGLGSMKTIGILCPDVSDIYMAQAVSVLEDELKQHEYQTLLVCSGYKQSEKEKCLNLLISKKVDALILIGSTYAGEGLVSDETLYVERAAQEVPIFMVNGYLPYENIYSVCCNDYQITYDVTTQMIQSGKKEILFLSNSKSYSAKQKRQGYEAALKAQGILIDEEKKLHYKNNIDWIKEQLITRRDQGFDGVIAVADNLAIGALKYAKAAGRDVPSELSVVGFNNSLLATYCEPELSSIDGKVDELCIMTVQNMIRLLESGEEIEKDSRIEGEFVRRFSSGF